MGVVGSNPARFTVKALSARKAERKSTPLEKFEALCLARFKCEIGNAVELHKDLS